MHHVWMGRVCVEKIYSHGADDVFYRRPGPIRKNRHQLYPSPDGDVLASSVGDAED
jgi:hypothetical protein